MKPKIELFEFRHPSLLIEAPTGVIYTNQTGGTYCAHPEVEGYLVPLYGFVVEDLAALTDAWYPESAEVTGTVKLAVFEEAFRLASRSPYGKDDLNLKFDSSPRGPWGEAWIPVTCSLGKGWVTHENSD